MKSITIIPLYLCGFIVFCPPGQAAPSADDTPLFYCPTDDGGSITLAKQEGKLALTLNGKSHVSDETVREISKTYRRNIRKGPEYNVVSFHINGIEYSIGSFKDLATQAEPSGKLFSTSYDKNRLPDVFCSFGEDVNQLSALAK
ncbi:hypothetical protein AU490_11120 [Lonsdalea populi]|uniref:Uncharacterized protein n=2 Tax=Lonsdalea TaxID=1082702 RepID=A0ACD1JCQ7_9GAMM|nr:hypothetical protein AU508_13380 [Lonsdalea populi]RAT13735.1 hypothetical protein AU485_07795 [Lonsdalea quercina]OSM99741.1 hypothetical protein AU499_11530 [Lonsdalea populi]RAT15825.1 hypothetical protein AU486_09195 [Lonsdalea quercina]RAT19518.1 hypothetical protein AU487_10940 [Lonsdalea populi]